MSATAEMIRLFQFRTLLRLLIERDLKVRYKRSFLGLFWTMLTPLLSMLVLTAVFSHLFQPAIESYPVYLLCGLTAWNFFAQGTTLAAPAVLSNANLIRKISLPKTLFPLSSVTSTLLNLLFSLPSLALIMIVLGRPIHLSILVLPLSIVLLYCFTCGVALLLSAAVPFYHDILHFYGIVVQIGFFLVPLVYPITILPEDRRAIFLLNPMYYYVELFREPIYNGTIPSLRYFLVGIIAAGLSFGIGLWYFHRQDNRFINYV